MLHQKGRPSKQLFKPSALDALDDDFVSRTPQDGIRRKHLPTPLDLMEENYKPKRAITFIALWALGATVLG